MKKAIHSLIPLLIFLLLIRGLILVGMILYAGIGLGPDEAQYWTWSQDLDWGYYSKPPGIAWMIWIGTQIFGNTELGVRFSSIILGSFLCASVYPLAKACTLQEKTAFWSTVCMMFAPIGILASFLAITDVGMTLFWVFSTYSTVVALQKGKTPNFYLIGFWIALGALFKWPIYFFWILLLLYFRFENIKQIVAGIVISFLGIVPSMIWNAKNDWATFRHVFTTLSGGHGKEIGTFPLFHGNFWDFLGSQFILLSPIFFLLFLLAALFYVGNSRRMPEGIRFCGFTSIATLLFLMIVSLFHKVQGNWGDFIHPAAIVFFCWHAFENKPTLSGWVKTGTYLSIALILLAFSIPIIQSKSLFVNMEIPYKFNPFRHNVGWDHLNKILKNNGYDQKKDFLFGDKYQMSSILSFYGPDQKRAYFLNLRQARQNQFSFWPGLEEKEVGKDGYFVHVENSENNEEFYLNVLKPFFKEVHYQGNFPLFEAYGNPKKVAFIFKGIEYNGKQTDEPSLW